MSLPWDKVLCILSNILPPPTCVMTRSGRTRLSIGPMGCLTGNYLLMKGDLKPQDILALMQDTFRFVAEYEGEVPGAAPQDCGNYLLHDLPMAKWESAKYLHEVLEQMKEENMKYPEKKKIRGLAIRD